MYYFDGLTCRSHRPADQPLAPVCTALRAQAPQVVTSTLLPFRFYDILHAGPFDPSALTKRRAVLQQIPDGEETLVSLRRLR